MTGVSACTPMRTLIPVTSCAFCPARRGASLEAMSASLESQSVLGTTSLIFLLFVLYNSSFAPCHCSTQPTTRVAHLFDAGGYVLNFVHGTFWIPIFPHDVDYFVWVDTLDLYLTRCETRAAW